MTSPDTLVQTIRSCFSELAVLETGGYAPRRVKAEAALDSLLALLAERERDYHEAVDELATELAEERTLHQQTMAERDAAVREAATLREALELMLTCTVSGAFETSPALCESCRDKARAALAAAAPAETPSEPSALEKALSMMTRIYGPPAERCECGGARWFEGATCVAEVHPPGCAAPAETAR